MEPSCFGSERLTRISIGAFKSKFVGSDSRVVGIIVAITIEVVAGTENFVAWPTFDRFVGRIIAEGRRTSG